MISLKTRYSDYIFNDPVYNIIACFYFNPNQIETNLPITQIAYNLGFHSLVHMRAAFFRLLLKLSILIQIEVQK